MASLVLTGDTSGQVTIAAPAVAGTTTLTLTGTILTSATAGTVLQVVNANYGTLQTTSSSTFTDTGLTASITPTSATSKILVLVNQCGVRKDTGDTGVGLRLLRGATVILKFEDSAGNTNSAAQNFIGSVSTSYLDSPATTSATTYKTQFNSWGNIANARVQAFDGATASTITLMEIAA
jgi:hypothetical protein